MMKYLIIISLVSVVWACGSGAAPPQQKEAAKVHLEAIAIEDALAGKADSLIQMKNRLSIQGRTLTPEEIAFNSAVSSIENSLHYWRENIPEPAGMEHDQHTHGGHDHHHHHGPELDVTPEQMLAIQKEFRDSIVNIRERILQLLPQ